jgi:hypothetical protein
MHRESAFGATRRDSGEGCLFRVPLLRTMHLFFAASFEAKNRVPLLRTML